MHLLLGHTGISGSNVENEVERFCNDVAGEFLLPERELAGLVLDSHSDVRQIAERITALAAQIKVSSAMVAYKVLRCGLVSQTTYNQLAGIFRQAWHGERERRRAQAREQESGPSYYRVRRHRLGNRIIGLTERMMTADTLSTSKAAQILGVKPRQVQSLLNASRAR